jgi:hypothetical protein
MQVACQNPSLINRDQPILGATDLVGLQVFADFGQWQFLPSLSLRIAPHQVTLRHQEHLNVTDVSQLSPGFRHFGHVLIKVQTHSQVLLLLD